MRILNDRITATALWNELAKRGILIRDCSTFVGLDDTYLRVTVREAEENQRLIKALRRIFNQSKL